MTNTFVLVCSLLCVLSVHAEDCSKYHVPNSKTPGFHTIEDYQGQHIRRHWDLEPGSISLSQDANDACVLSWRKDNVNVRLELHSDKAVDQTWQFPGATIKLRNAADRAVFQKWYLGKKWLQYERQADGAVKSSGNANSADLDKFKREIDCWCDQNPRFFRSEYCPIYDN